MLYHFYKVSLQCSERKDYRSYLVCKIIIINIHNDPDIQSRAALEPSETRSGGATLDPPSVPVAMVTPCSQLRMVSG